MLILHERSGRRSVSDSWPIEFSGVAPSCFSPDYFSGCIAHKIGRLVQHHVQGSSLYSVMGQETCE